MQAGCVGVTELQECLGEMLMEFGQATEKRSRRLNQILTLLGV